MRTDEGRQAEPWFTVSAAAELAGMHPQTLRQYDRLGLVTPSRAKGRGRRYSSEDLLVLREVQRLSQEEGVNLAGVALVLELRRRVQELERELDSLRAAALTSEPPPKRVFAADRSGAVRQRPPTTGPSSLKNWRGSAATGPRPKQVGTRQRGARRGSLVSAGALQGWQRLAYLQLLRSLPTETPIRPGHTERRPS